MFRLNKEIDGRRTRLTFDGDITSECIESLEKCCDDAVSDGRQVDLVLRDVTGLDAAGQAFLRRLVARGVSLSASGVYMSYLLDDIRNTPPRDSKRLNRSSEASR